MLTGGNQPLGPNCVHAYIRTSSLQTYTRDISITCYWFFFFFCIFVCIYFGKWYFVQRQFKQCLLLWKYVYKHFILYKCSLCSETLPLNLMNTVHFEIQTPLRLNTSVTSQNIWSPDLICFCRILFSCDEWQNAFCICTYCRTGLKQYALNKCNNTILLLTDLYNTNTNNSRYEEGKCNLIQVKLKIIYVPVYSIKNDLIC